MARLSAQARAGRSKAALSMPDRDADLSTARLFALFNEVGIINQLASALFEARLPSGIVVSQFSVLNHLIRVKDGRTPLELSRAFQVPKTTITHSLAVLSRHGLIRMSSNPRDGRSKCVWITHEGRAFRDAAIASLTPDMREISARFPAPLIDDLLSALTRLRQIMDEMRES